MIEQIISQRLQIALPQVQGTVRLLRDGATIPFISRYRKEATGSLDELQVGAVKEQLERLTELEARRQTVLSTIEEQGKLTPELRRRIEGCWDSVELEDLYLPYKPKRRTRATVARERGLEPLADLIMAQQARDAAQQARRYVSAEVPTPEEALAGACDIIAERISEDEQARNGLRRTFAREGVVHSKLVKGKEAEGAKYSDYFDAATPLRSISSHRFLAMRRGADEGILKITVDVDADRCIEGLCRRFIRPGSATRTWMEAAAADSFKRLMRPSIETEQLAAAKERADDEAIRVFAENLRQLLLSSPLGQKRVIALDPGFRTGCKVVALDSQGNLVHNTTVYPHAPQNRWAEAAETLKALAAKYRAEAFAIGDGTAGNRTAGPRAGSGGRRGVHGERGRRVGLLGIGRGTRGISRLRRDGARGREHRTPFDRPAFGAGQNRPQVDRRRAVPAQRGPAETQGTPGHGRGELRQPCRREHQHRLETHPDLYFGAGPRAGGEHRGLPRRKRGFQKPQGAAQGAAAGSQSLRTGSGVPARRGRQEPAGQQRRASRIVPHRRTHGRRCGRHRGAAARGQGPAQGHTSRKIRERRGGAADRDGHPRGARQAGSRPAGTTAGLRVRPQCAHDRRPAPGNAPAGHRDEHHGLRGLRRYRRQAGRTGAHLAAGRPLRRLAGGRGAPGPARRGEGHGYRHRPQPHLADHAPERLGPETGILVTIPVT